MYLNIARMLHSLQFSDPILYDGYGVGNSNSNVLFNAPYFDYLTVESGADGLPRWSSSQVLATNYYVCGVCV